MLNSFIYLGLQEICGGLIRIEGEEAKQRSQKRKKMPPLMGLSFLTCKMGTMVVLNLVGLL